MHTRGFDHTMQALLLTAYMKMLVASPNQGELKELVQSAFTRYAR